MTGAMRRQATACLRTVALLAAPLLFTVSLMLVAFTARADGFTVHNANFRVADGVVNMDADIRFEFSEGIREALRNGVDLTVIVETEVMRVRDYLWNDPSANVATRFGIEFHPLSDQYLLRNLNLGITQSFTSLDALTAELGRVRDFPLIGVARLSAAERYTVRIQARLDIESLPAPMRPLAYLSSLWRLESDWHEWDLAI
jgi:hypothetical protein